MFESTGRRFREGLGNTLYGLGFFFEVLKESLFFLRRGRAGFRILVMQVLFTGVEALRVVGLLALAIGVAINLIGSSLLAGFGQGQLVYTLLVVVITRELGPLLTAFIVTARSGTAIATELGGMVVSHEIEAYVAVGANPISHLAAPRFLGVTVSMLVLGVYFNVFGLLGSFAVMQVIKPVALGDYLRGLLGVLTVRDVISGVVKCLVFGAIVSTVSMHKGFSVERASTEIPVAGIRAVGSSFSLCILADAAITVAQYLG